MQAENKQTGNNELVAAIKKVSVGYLILMIIFTLAYMLEFIKGNRTLGYTIVFLLIGWIPFGLGKFLSQVKGMWEVSKWIYVVGYTVLYIFALLTGRATTYVYLLPMMFVFMLTNDVKLISIVSAMAVVANIVGVIVGYGSAADKAAFITDAEIQILVILVSAIFSIITVKFLHNSSVTKIKAAEDDAAKISGMMDSLNAMVNEASTRISASDSHAQEIDSNLASCENMMSELTSGAELVANTSEAQLTATQGMFDEIEKLKAVSAESAQNMDNVLDSLNVCMTAKDNLVNGIAGVVEKSQSAQDRAMELKETAEAMNGIVELINAVANQTRLLSLNASIEAARAGDAGRGFAVVASEIGGLVEKTTSATSEIVEKINMVRAGIESVTSNITSIRNEISAQAENSTEMGTRFDEMATMIDNVRSGMTEQDKAVNSIYNAGTEISEGISTLSGVSEETTASASETLNMLHAAADSVGELVNELNALSETVQNR